MLHFSQWSSVSPDLIAADSASGDMLRDGEPGAPPGGSSLDFLLFGWNMSEIFI